MLKEKNSGAQKCASDAHYGGGTIPASPVQPRSQVCAEKDENAQMKKIRKEHAQEQMVIDSFGDAEFEENMQILRRLGIRALRSVSIAGFGVVAYLYALRKTKSKSTVAEADCDDKEEDDQGNDNTNEKMDPTLRYLKEMKDQGWDISLKDEQRIR